MIQHCSHLFVISIFFLHLAHCTSLQEYRRFIFGCPDGEEWYCFPHTLLCSCIPTVNGGWSEWSSSPCSATCGEGTKQETRSCTNPAPSHSGKHCEGATARVTPCNDGQCPSTTPVPIKCSSDVNCTDFNCPRQQHPFCEPNLDWSACGCTECTKDHHCSCSTGMIGHCRVDDIFERKCECKPLPGAKCKNDSDCSTHTCTGNQRQSFCHEKRFLTFDFSSCDCRECSKDSDCHCLSGSIPRCEITAFGITCHCDHVNATTPIPIKCSSDVNCTDFNCPGQQHPFCEPNLDWSTCGCTECTKDHHCSCSMGMIGHCRVDDIFKRKCECKQLPGAKCKNDSDCSTHTCTGNQRQSFCHEKKFLTFDFSSCDCRECFKDSDCQCLSGLIPRCEITAFGNTCHCGHVNESSTVHISSTHSMHSKPPRTTSTVTFTSPTSSANHTQTQTTKAPTEAATTSIINTTIKTTKAPTEAATTSISIPVLSSDPFHQSSTRSTDIALTGKTKSTETTTDSTQTPQLTNTTKPRNHTLIMITLTTKPPEGARKCHVCGDSANSIPCDTRAIYMGNLQDCAPGEDYCMTDLIHDGQAFPSIYKRCVTEDVCRNEWLHQTSDVEHCTNYGNVLVEGHYSCHFCCTSDGCNSMQTPEKSTLYIKA